MPIEAVDLGDKSNLINLIYGVIYLINYLIEYLIGWLS